MKGSLKITQVNKSQFQQSTNLQLRKYLSIRNISCGHTTDFYLGKLPRANSSKISRGKFISALLFRTLIQRAR